MRCTAWPKRPTYWQKGAIAYASIPFTWGLPEVRTRIECDLFASKWVVGGPAVELMPRFFKGLSNVSVGGKMSGVLQRVNPEATRTSAGCPRQCGFCAVPRVEGRFRELDDWPDLPVICDNNLLAASREHFDRVIERLAGHEWCDFNQGLDARFLTQAHAQAIGGLKGAIVRLSLDSAGYAEAWVRAYSRLRAAGVAKARLRTYVLIGYRSGPAEAWARCEFVEKRGVKALPQWFHPLNAMCPNGVTPLQRALGWTESERKRIMGWFYQHRGKPLEARS